MSKLVDQAVVQVCEAWVAYKKSRMVVYINRTKPTAADLLALNETFEALDAALDRLQQHADME